MIDPWTGTHDDRPDWDDRGPSAALLALVVLAWTPLAAVVVWGWRTLRG